MVELLVQHAVSDTPHLAASPEKLRINYETFSAVAVAAGPKFASFLTASAFLRVRSTVAAAG